MATLCNCASDPIPSDPIQSSSVLFSFDLFCSVQLCKVQLCQLRFDAVYCNCRTNCTADVVQYKFVNLMISIICLFLMSEIRIVQIFMTEGM